MKNILLYAALPGLVLLPACGRQQPKVIPPHITETRVTAERIEGNDLKALVGRKAYRLHRHGISTFAITVENAGPETLVLKPSSFGLNLISSATVESIVGRKGALHRGLSEGSKVFQRGWFIAPLLGLGVYGACMSSSLSRGDYFSRRTGAEILGLLGVLYGTAALLSGSIAVAITSGLSQLGLKKRSQYTSFKALKQSDNGASTPAGQVGRFIVFAETPTRESLPITLEEDDGNTISLDALRPTSQSTL